MIRRFLTFAALAATLTLTACGAKQDNSSAPAMRSVTLMLDYTPNADHVGIYTALAQGEFRKVGLNVQIKTPPRPSAPLQVLAAGEADLVISYEPELLIARDKGAAVLSVGAIAQRPLTSLISVDDKPVDPRKLEGTKIGTAGLPFQDALLDQLMSAAGVDTSKVTKVDVGFGLIGAMLSKRVAATLGGFWNIEGVQLRQQKHRPRMMPVDRAGVPPYDELVLVARNETVSRNGAMIRRFIGALQRGTRTVRANPQTGVAALRAANPQLSKKLATATVVATLPVLFPPSRRPFGWQEPAEWQSFADWMTRNDLLRGPVDTGQALTNEFLPGEGLGPETHP